MTSRDLLEPAAVRAALADLPDWEDDPDGENPAIRAAFEFADFPTAMAFLVRLGFAAEQRNHHPELTNVYNRVGVRLTTHDAGGVTALDIELAATASDLAARFGAG